MSEEAKTKAEAEAKAKADPLKPDIRRLLLNDGDMVVVKDKPRTRDTPEDANPIAILDEGKWRKAYLRKLVNPGSPVIAVYDSKGNPPEKKELDEARKELAAQIEAQLRRNRAQGALEDLAAALEALKGK